MIFPELKSIATRNVITIPSEATVNEAVRLMTEHNIRDVIVLKEGRYFLFHSHTLLDLKLKNADFSQPLNSFPLPEVPDLPFTGTVADVLPLMHNRNDYIIITGENRELFGIVGFTDIASVLDPQLLAHSVKLSDFLEDLTPLTAEPGEPLSAAMQKMKTKSQSAIVVLNGTVPAGILTRSDIIRLVHSGISLDVPLKDVMSAPIISVPDSMTIHDALIFTREKKIKRILISDKEGNLSGIISQRELVALYFNQWIELLKTHQSQMTELNRTLETITEEVPGGLIVTDADGRITRVNKEAAILLGYDQAEMHGNHILSYFRCGENHSDFTDRTIYCDKLGREIPAGACPAFLNLNSRLSFTGHEILRKKDNNFIIADIKARHISSEGRSPGFIFLFHDITEADLQVRELRRERDLFTGGPVIVFVWKAEEGWPVEYVSPNIVKTFGYSPEEILNPGFRFTSVIHPDDAPSVAEEAQNYINQKRPSWEQLYRIRSRSGKYHFIYDFTVPEYDENGGLRRLLGYILDRTDEINAKSLLTESEERWRFVLEATNQGVWDWNAHTNEVFFSKQWKKMLGYEEDEIGTSLSEWETRIHPDDLEKTLADIKKHFSGETEYYENEHRVRCKDGTYKWILDRGQILSRTETGEPLRVIGTHTDISEHRRIQAELEQTVRNLKMAKEEADRASRAKGEFLANMSHEIRTPMNAVLGYSQLLKDTPLTRLQYNYLNKIDYSSRMLLGIINDILDYSKIEAGKLELEKQTFRLTSLLDQMAALFSSQAADKNLGLIFRLKPDVPEEISGDSLRLGQVLTNLLSNAVKFTSQGEILLEISLIEKKDKECTIRFLVKDSGIGMSSEQMKKLFHPFTQADSSTTRRFGGTGLGLVISSRIIELMGTRLVVISEAGQGTSVSFDLKTEYTVPEHKGISHIFSSEKTAWIADVSRAAGDTLEELLQFISVHTVRFRNFTELLHAPAPEKNPDFIFIHDPSDSHADMSSKTRQLKKAYPDSHIYFTGTAEKPLFAARDFGYIQSPVTASSLYESLVSGAPDAVIRHRNEQNADIPDLKGKTILAVEDNDINRDLISRMLRKTGAEILLGSGGLEGVQLAVQHHPDLILMDLQMPDIDGYEATRRIRSSLPDVPVIALTAAALKEDRNLAEAAGMNEFLTKPVNSSELYKAARSLFLKAGSVKREVLTDNAEIISFERGLELADNEKEFYESALIKFLHKLKNDYSKVFILISEKRYAEAARITHSLKGTAGMLGAVKLQETSGKTDDHIRRNGSVSPEILEELRTVYKETEDFLENHIRNQKGNSRSVTGQGDISHLRLLWNKLEKSEFIEESLTESALQYLSSTFPDLTDIISETGKRIAAMDYPGAAELISRTASQKEIKLNE